jgi:protein subunit release factor B
MEGKGVGRRKVENPSGRAEKASAEKTRLRPDGFAEKSRAAMDLPSQIQARLEALGVRVGDLDEYFVRGSGAGGQKINKTSSTVCLRHRPTGLEVRCQRERSQAANREIAWTELCARLEARRRAAAQAHVDARELHRRQTRQKHRGHKVAMIHAKKHRAHIKSARGRAGEE